MPEPNLLTPSAVETGDDQVWDAVVATDAKDPTEAVFVTIEDFDGEGTSWRHGPCKWTPRPEPTGLFYPKRNDECCVAITPAGIWIIGFTPKAVAPDAVY